MSQPPFILFLLDDDEDDQLFIKTAFESIGFGDTIYSFNSGKQLLDSLNDGVPDPDIFVLDYDMPRMTGKDILIAIKAMDQFRQTPVVFYSDKINSSLEKELKSLGAYCCIRKGTTTKDQVKFAQTIRDLLNK